jgi:hypothetical protein
VVDTRLPFHETSETGTNPVPVTVSVNAALPTDWLKRGERNNGRRWIVDGKAECAGRAATRRWVPYRDADRAAEVRLDAGICALREVLDS